MKLSRAASRRVSSLLHAAVRCEALECRILLSSVVHSSYYTFAAIDPQEADIPVYRINDYKDPAQVTPKSLTLTDKYGTHTYNGKATALTKGTDPAVWDASHSGSMSASAEAFSSIVNSNGHVMATIANANLEYYMDLESVQPLPATILSVIKANGYMNVPITVQFSAHASLDGLAGSYAASIEASISAKLVGDKGETIYENSARATAGSSTAQFDDTVNAVIRFVPLLRLDWGHVYVYLQATANATLQLPNGAGGSLTASAFTDPQTSFDQGAFTAICGAMGIPEFNLSDYFKLAVGDPEGFHAPMDITTPDLTDASDTGPSQTDNITGDRTPTFTGTVTDPFGYTYSMTIQLPPGIELPPGFEMPSLPNMPKVTAPTIAVLYVDGVEAGRAKLTNPHFNMATGETTFDYTLTASPLAEGTHAIMVAAGSSDASLTTPSEPLLVTIDGGIPLGNSTTLTLGAGGLKAIAYTDADGTTATLQLTAGSATVTLDGDNLSQVDTLAGSTITGENIVATAIAITGDTALAAFSITLRHATGSDRLLNIGALSTAGAIKSISAAGVNVWDDITLGGPITTLTLGSVFGPSTLLISGDATKPAATLTFARVSNLTLTSQIPLKAIKALEWLDTDGVIDPLSAPSIASLATTGVKASTYAPAVAGDFVADVTLSGDGVPVGKLTLGLATIVGSLHSSHWAITGSMGNLTVSGTVGHVDPTFGVTIRTTGSMGALTFAAALHADLLAGVDPTLGGDAALTRRADNLLDFTNPAAIIKSITVAGPKLPRGAVAGSYFVDSNFSAATIGTVSITNAPFNNDQAGLDDTQDNFGFFSRRVTSIKHRLLNAPALSPSNFLWKPALDVPAVADDLTLAPLV